MHLEHWKGFIGYLEGVKGYKIWCIDLNPPKCIISRDVIFNENELAVKRQPIEETNFDTKTFEIVEFEVEASGHKSIKGVADSKDADIDPNNTMGTQQPI